jgi:hypothetical protein
MRLGLRALGLRALGLEALGLEALGSRGCPTVRIRRPVPVGLPTRAVRVGRRRVAAKWAEAVAFPLQGHTGARWY